MSILLVPNANPNLVLLTILIEDGAVTWTGETPIVAWAIDADELARADKNDIITYASPVTLDSGCNEPIIFDRSNGQVIYTHVGRWDSKDDAIACLMAEKAEC